MSPKGLPVSSNKRKQLERTWRYFSRPEVLRDPETGLERTIQRCDFRKEEQGEVRGWLSIGVDPSLSDDTILFGGEGRWSRTVCARTLELALAGMVERLRFCKRRVRGAEEHLARLHPDEPLAAEAARYVRAEIDDCKAMIALCESVLTTISDFDSLLESFREGSTSLGTGSVDERDQIGARLGYACGPPTHVRRFRPSPTRSLAHLSGALDEGPNISSSEYAAQTADEGD